MTDSLTVELVLATAEKQVLVAVIVDEGASVADVIAASGIQSRFPCLEIGEMPAGIWGKPVPKDRIVRHGDRVELYRPLEMDPRKARRQRARAGKT